MKDFFLKPSNPHKVTVDTYIYKFNEYVDSLAGKQEHFVHIIFTDNKFDRLEWFNHKPNQFDVKEMNLMKLIQDEIKNLEKNYIKTSKQTKKIVIPGEMQKMYEEST